MRPELILVLYSWLYYLGGFKSTLVAGSHTRPVRSKSWAVPPSSALLFPFPPIPFPLRLFFKSSSVWLQRTAKVENHKVQRKKKEYLSRTLGVQGQRLEVSRSAAKSLQSCPTLCDPIVSSPPGSPVPGILQARTLEWVAISFSKVWKWKVEWRLLRPWDFPGKSAGVGCHCLLWSRSWL